MLSFLHGYASEIKGVLSGFDRIRFLGTIRLLANVTGLSKFLSCSGVLLKDFKEWARGTTETMLEATERLAIAAGRPVVYLPSSQERKEDRALAIAEQDGVTQGLICVLKCVEPCYSLTVGPNREKRRLEVRRHWAKCSHLYFYLHHAELGLLSVRLQTWVPFNIHVCINGRSWLARRLRRAGLAYEQRDNCFVDVADAERAQRLFDEQLGTRWERLLNRLVRQVHPAHRTMFGNRGLSYYWSATETEWATDVMFRSRESLAAIFPRLRQHAISSFASGDVLRFLGRCPEVTRFKSSEVTTTLKTRPEGTRVKHAVNGNSVKMYDKQESVLRVETTINNTRDMKVFRRKEGENRGSKSWQRLRKGVADLHRRAQISQKANERYLEALAAVEHAETLGHTVRDLCQPTIWQGRRVRALQPLHLQDMQLLEAISRGEFMLHGFRNRDLRPVLFGDAPVSAEQGKRQSGKITRLIRLVRAHGLVQKVTKTHRYQLTSRGRTAIAALLAAQRASTQQLTKMAA